VPQYCPIKSPSKSAIIPDFSQRFPARSLARISARSFWKAPSRHIDTRSKSMS